MGNQLVITYLGAKFELQVKLKLISRSFDTKCELQCKLKLERKVKLTMINWQARTINEINVHFESTYVVLCYQAYATCDLSCKIQFLRAKTFA